MTMSAEQRHAESQRLAGLWSRISRQHLSSGQGCACGFGGGLILQGASFELDIIEFVVGEAKKNGHADVERFVDAVSKRGPDRYSLPDLLEAIGKTNSDLEQNHSQLDFILTRISNVLEAMDATHSQRFACG
jgi:hypothetical protein